jgi:hypothetical protein
MLEFFMLFVVSLGIFIRLIEAAIRESRRKR